MNRSLSTWLQVNFSLERLLVGAIAIGVALRFLNLGSREFWYDEILSVLLSTGQKIAYRDPPDVPVALAEYSALLSLPAEATLRDAIATVANLLRGIVASEPHPPLFFLFQHFWLRLFGNGEAAMRSLTALSSIGAIASAYGLARIVLGHRGALVLAALLATNPFYLFHSLNLRMYGSLVLWTTLSGWALLEKVGAGFLARATPDAFLLSPSARQSVFFPLLWDIVLMVSVAAGLLTFYLFIYWIVALAVAVLYLDWRRGWQYGVGLGAGVALSIPWLVWGIPQQLRNADLQRFAAPSGLIEAGMRHLHDVVDTLGIHLLLGDWVTSVGGVTAAIAGCVVSALLALAIASLLRRRERRVLALAVFLGIFPLLLMLLADVVTGKFTVGFGWGRGAIFTLPGCLLLASGWIERACRYKKAVVAGLLLLYLSIGISDFSFRERQVFHKIADAIAIEPQTPTLIAMNTKAWGHVLRLAYYVPDNAPVTLLARESEKLPASLEKILKFQAETYFRIIWLESAEPVWSKPATKTETEKIKQIFARQFQMIQQQSLRGTMELDRFTLTLYKRVSQP